MEELIKKAKEVYNLSGKVYIFEDGNIFTIKQYADIEAKNKGVNYTEVDLDEPKKEEIKEDIKKKNK